MLSDDLRRLADIIRQNPPATQVSRDRVDQFLRLASAEAEQLEAELARLRTPDVHQART